MKPESTSSMLKFFHLLYLWLLNGEISGSYMQRFTAVFFFILMTRQFAQAEELIPVEYYDDEFMEFNLNRETLIDDPVIGTPRKDVLFMLEMINFRRSYSEKKILTNGGHIENRKNEERIEWASTCRDMLDLEEQGFHYSGFVLTKDGVLEHLNVNSGSFPYTFCAPFRVPILKPSKTSSLSTNDLAEFMLNRFSPFYMSGPGRTFNTRKEYYDYLLLKPSFSSPGSERSDKSGLFTTDYSIKVVSYDGGESRDIKVLARGDVSGDGVEDLVYKEFLCYCGGTGRAAWYSVIYGDS